MRRTIFGALVVLGFASGAQAANTTTREVRALERIAAALERECRK